MGRGDWREKAKKHKERTITWTSLTMNLSAMAWPCSGDSDVFTIESKGIFQGVMMADEPEAAPSFEPPENERPASAPGEAGLGASGRSDLELMRAIQAGDADALSQLYDRYNGILKALILRVIHNDSEADDLLQEIFMEIWNQAKNFRAEKGKPLGWMVTLARRRAIDGLRKKQAYARAEERLQSETAQQPDAWVHNITEQEISLGDTRVLVRKVLDSLPPAQQQAIELAFFQGMSQREIAAKTATPLGHGQDSS